MVVVSATTDDRVDMPEALLDVNGLAVRLGVSVKFVRKLVDQRRVPFVRIGRLVRFDPTAVTAWLASNRVDPVSGRGLHRDMS
jgi:excisionase family DNA binding protein